MILSVDFAPPGWVEAIGRWAVVAVAISVPAWWLIKTAVGSVIRPTIHDLDVKYEKHMLDQIALRNEQQEDLAEMRKELLEAVDATHNEVMRTRQEVMAAVAAVDNRVAVVEGHVGVYARKP